MTTSLRDIRLEDFNDFIEESNFFCDVCKIFADYYIEPVKTESREFDSKDINEKISRERPESIDYETIERYLIWKQLRSAKELFRELSLLMKRADYLKGVVYGEDTEEPVEIE